MSSIGAEILAGEFLRAGLSVKFVARGQSMRPLIRDGAILHIKPLDSARPRKGDILFCHLPAQDGENVLVHRLLRYLPDGRLLTKGDHQPLPDRPVFLNQVLGRVSQVEQAGNIKNLERPLWRGIGWLIATVYNWRSRLRRSYRKLQKN